MNLYTDQTRMRGMRRLGGILLLTAIFPMVGACGAQERQGARAAGEMPTLQAADPAPYPMSSDGAADVLPSAPGQVLVQFRDGVGAEEVGRIESETGLRTLKVVSAPRLYLMQITDGSTVEGMLRRLKGYPEVVQAEPNFPRTLKRN
jgi:hypothetical protein